MLMVNGTSQYIDHFCFVFLKRSHSFWVFYSYFFHRVSAGLQINCCEMLISFCWSTCSKGGLRIEAFAQRCSVKKVFFRNFVKFTGRHLCQSFFFESLWYRCFPVNFTRFLRTPFFKEHLRRLLLSVGY